MIKWIFFSLPNYLMITDSLKLDFVINDWFGNLAIIELSEMAEIDRQLFRSRIVIATSRDEPPIYES